MYSGSREVFILRAWVISAYVLTAFAIEKIQSRRNSAGYCAGFVTKAWYLGIGVAKVSAAAHHTAPVNSLYALHESLVMLKNEGLENTWKRHQEMYNKLKNGLDNLGFEFVVEPDIRLPQLNTILVPQGIDDARVRGQLLNQYNLEIGAGLGDLSGKAWRIGLMGYGARNENVSLCLRALEEVMAL